MRIVARPAPPTGLVRLLFRAPIYLYRMRLGFLFGGRLVLLNHIGMRTGIMRRVVIEVTDRRPDGSIVVCSGFGPRANWYRNLLKTPRATIQIGLRTIAVTAEPLTADEGGQAMVGYALRHPKAARRLARYMGYAVDGSDADFRAVGLDVPFVRLIPRVG